MPQGVISVCGAAASHRPPNAFVAGLLSVSIDLIINNYILNTSTQHSQNSSENTSNQQTQTSAQPQMGPPGGPSSGAGFLADSVLQFLLQKQISEDSTLVCIFRPREIHIFGHSSRRAPQHPSVAAARAPLRQQEQQQLAGLSFEFVV